MQKKIMWTLITVSSSIATYALGFIWGSIVTIPLTVGCWWVAYKSGWFDGMS